MLASESTNFERSSNQMWKFIDVTSGTQCSALRAKSGNWFSAPFIVGRYHVALKWCSAGTNAYKKMSAFIARTNKLNWKISLGNGVIFEMNAIPFLHRVIRAHDLHLTHHLSGARVQCVAHNFSDFHVELFVCAIAMRRGTQLELNSRFVLRLAKQQLIYLKRHSN